MRTINYAVTLQLTYLDTSAAGHAFPCIIKQFLAERLGFRIMTPNAMQRASLHKDNSPYARPVMDREFLNVKYQVFHLISTLD